MYIQTLPDALILKSPTFDLFHESYIFHLKKHALEILVLV